MNSAPLVHVFPSLASYWLIYSSYFFQNSVLMVNGNVVLVSIQTPPCFILKRVTGHSARVNPLLFTRVSGTRCNVHSSPFLTNSKSVCQRPSERAHIHRALHTVSEAHARTDAHRHVGSLCRNIEDRRGKGSGELPFICPQLPSLRLLVSF